MVDTKAKRASVQAYLGMMRPPPDSAVNEGDRATVAWLYAGLDYAEPALVERLVKYFINYFTNFGAFSSG